MKLFFAFTEMTKLADSRSSVLSTVRATLQSYDKVREVDSPEEADAIIIQEEKTTFKEFRYIDKLLSDPFISEYLTKIYTISTDDSSTGLLRGLYTSMPKSRYNPDFHRIVPFLEYANPLVFTDQTEVEPVYLAGWYGNTKSNKIRRKLVHELAEAQDFCIRTSDSWYNHKGEEQKAYVDLIKSSKFSLCPAGWCPATPRIYESMALGRCPVIIADKYQPPMGPSWKDFALLYPQGRSLSKLRSYLLEHEPYYRELGARAKENWDKYFAGDLIKQYYADSLLSLIRTTTRYTKEMEIKRWRSFSTYWKNNWTIPQRAVNKWRMFFEPS